MGRMEFVKRMCEQLFELAEGSVELGKVKYSWGQRPPLQLSFVAPKASCGAFINLIERHSIFVCFSSMDD